MLSVAQRSFLGSTVCLLYRSTTGISHRRRPRKGFQYQCTIDVCRLLVGQGTGKPDKLTACLSALRPRALARSGRLSSSCTPHESRQIQQQPTRASMHFAPTRSVCVSERVCSDCVSRRGASVRNPGRAANERSAAHVSTPRGTYVQGGISAQGRSRTEQDWACALCPVRVGKRVSAQHSACPGECSLE